MIPATRGRRRCHDRSHGSCCCSHQTASIGARSLRPDDTVLIQSTGYRIPDPASILCPIAGRRAGTRTGPSTADGGLYSRHHADLRPFGIDVSEKYLAFDEERCYYDSQPEPPLFTVLFNNLTISENGDSGYFFNLLTGH